MREQVSSLIDAARVAATEIERKAVDSAEADRRSAHARAQRVREAATAMERELITLRVMVAREADGLRARIDRTLLLSAGARASLPMSLERNGLQEGRALASSDLDEDVRPVLSPGMEEHERLDDAGPAPEAEEAAPSTEKAEVEPDGAEIVAAGAETSVPEADDPQLDPTDVAVDIPRQAEPAEEDTAEEDTAERAAVVEEVPEAAEDTAEAYDVAAEDGEVEVQNADHAHGGGFSEEFIPPPPGEGDAASLDEEAKTRVAALTDIELAELYAIASARAGGGPDDEMAYWAALKTAVIQKAASRPEFGRPAKGEEVGGRRAKKRRAKLLEALMAARKEGG